MRGKRACWARNRPTRTFPKSTQKKLLSKVSHAIDFDKTFEVHKSMGWQKSQKLCSYRNGKARPICVSGRRTRSTFCARAFATGLDVVDEAERPIAPINVFSSIGVYGSQRSRRSTARSGKSHARSVSSACVTIETRPTGTLPHTPLARFETLIKSCLRAGQKNQNCSLRRDGRGIKNQIRQPRALVEMLAPSM